MIRIACTNCKTVLSIDDAFAGGVCRCQHCGTIQTVPSRGKGNGDVVATSTQSQTLGGAKSLYSSEGRNPGSGTGLDDLASAVSSSGLTGSGLTSRRLRSSSGGPPTTPAKNNQTLLYVAAGVIVVLVLLVLWLAMRGGSSTETQVTNRPTDTTVTPSNNSVTTATESEPSFCGVKLDSGTVVFVLDRGSGSQNVFGAVKQATLKSIESLGSDRKFQVIFWAVGADKTVNGYPENATAYATKANIESCRRALDDIAAYGSTDAKPAFVQAIARNPAAIILATGKGSQLDESFGKELLDVRSASAVKVHAFNLGSSDPSPQLREIAKATGGEYRDLTETQLRPFGGE